MMKDEMSRDSGGSVHSWLQPWQEIWWNAGKCRVTIAQPWEDTNDWRTDLEVQCIS